MPATPAMALAVWAAYFLIGARYIWAGLFGGAATLFHPLVGMETLTIVGLAFLLIELFSQGGRALQRDIWWLGVGAALAGLIIALTWLLPNLGQETARLSDSEFFDILIATRAPHHYLALSFPTQDWYAALAMLASSLWVWAALPDDTRAAGVTQILALAAILVLLGSLLSILFVDLLEIRAWATAQLFRIIQVFKLAAYIGLGWIAGSWLTQGTWRAYLPVALLVLSSGNQQGYVALAFVALYLVDQHSFWTGKVRDATGVVVMFLCLALILEFDREPLTVRLALGGLALWLGFGFRRASMPLGLAALALIIALIALSVTTAPAGLAGNRKLKASYGPGDLVTPAADAMKQARGLSANGALWIVPPDFEGFRFLAGRALVMNWKSVPFEAEAMRHWAQAATDLYGISFGNGPINFSAAKAFYESGAGLGAARDIYGADFAITPLTTPWPGAPLYANEEYKIIALENP